MTSGMFVLRDSGGLVELKESPYDSEDLLQQLLAEHPNIMAGDQIDPSAPRRWLLIAREMAVPGSERGESRWALDHLFLDQDAVPTLVEVKRSTDTRIRREVVGQMLDYAANAVSYWSLERIQATFEDSCNVDGTDPAECLRMLVGDDLDPEEYWQTLKTNLRAGRIRMVFVADHLPPELRRIIEFLNEQMDPAVVLGLEVRQYVGEGLKTLVPRVIGLTTASQDRKTGGARSLVKWDEGSFFPALEDRGGSTRADIARNILRWAQSRDHVVWWGEGKSQGSFSPRILHNGFKYQLFVVWTGGKIGLYFDVLQKPPLDAENRRLAYLEQLNRIDGLDMPPELASKYSSFDLEILRRDEDLGAFLAVFDRMVEEIRES